MTVVCNFSFFWTYSGINFLMFEKHYIYYAKILKNKKIVINVQTASCIFTQKEFENYFTPLAIWRDKQINEILNG